MPRVPLLIAAAGLMAGAAWLGWRTAGKDGGPTLPDRAVGTTGSRPTGSARGAATQAKPKPVETSQAEAMVRQRGSTALSLLAMARLTGDPTWLRRAAEANPDDPKVRLALYHATEDPAERAAALAAYRAADPGNALGGYLAAWESGQQGDAAGLAAALVDASFAEGLRRDELAIVLEADAMLRASGMGDREAFEQAMTSMKADDAIALAGLGRNMGELQRLFVELGDWDEADFLLEETLVLGASLRQGGMAIDNLVGVSIERQLLGALDPQTVIGWDGERAGERLAALQEDWEKGIGMTSDEITEAMDQLDADGWAEYRRRLAKEGERAALRWLKDR